MDNFPVFAHASWCGRWCARPAALAGLAAVFALVDWGGAAGQFAARAPAAGVLAGSSQVAGGASRCASYLQQANEVLGSGETGRARQLLLTATHACPQMPELFSMLGLAEDFSGAPQAAQAAYAKAIALDPRNPSFHNNLAASYIRSGKTTAGIAEFRKVLALDPANRTGNLNLGTLYLRSKQYRQAISCFRAAGVEKSQDAPALLEMVQAYFGAGERDQAHELADRLSRIPGLDAKIHFSLGLELAKNSEYSMAAEQFESIPPAERDSATSLNLGMAYSELHEFEKSHAAYQEAIRLDPSSADAYLRMGLDASKQARHEAALDWMSQAKSRAPWRADISYALAEELIRMKNFARAREVLASALESNGRDAGLREAEGDLLLAEAQYREAEHAYLRCLQVDAQRMSARLSLARAYMELRENDKAKAQLQAVLRVRPGSAEAHAQLGRLALNTGDQKAALRSLRQALAADPNNVTANENFALLMDRQNKPDQARAALERLVALTPDNPQFHYLLSRTLSKLHKPELAKTEFELSKKLENAQHTARD